MESRDGQVMMSHLGRDSQGSEEESPSVESDSNYPLIAPFTQNENESFSNDESEFCIRPNYEVADIDDNASAEEDSSGFYSNMSPYTSCSNRSVNNDILMKTESGNTLHNETGSFASDADVSDLQNSKSSLSTPESPGNDAVFSNSLVKSYSEPLNESCFISNKTIQFDDMVGNKNIDLHSNTSENENKKCNTHIGEFFANMDEKSDEMNELYLSNISSIENMNEEELKSDINKGSDVICDVPDVVKNKDNEFLEEVCERFNKSKPIHKGSKSFKALQCNLIKIPTFSDPESPILMRSVDNDSCGVPPGICCDSVAQCDRRNNYIFGSAMKNVQDFGEVDRKFSVNEFGDTFGICEAVNDVFCNGAQVFEGGNLFDRSFSGLRDSSTDNSQINGENSLMSLNTHLMDILTDLDDVLERSLMEDSGGEDPGNYFEDKKFNLERITEDDNECFSDNLMLHYNDDPSKDTSKTPMSYFSLMSNIRETCPSPILEDELCRLSDIKLEIVEPIDETVPKDEGISKFDLLPSNLVSYDSDKESEASWVDEEIGECNIESEKFNADLGSADKENIKHNNIEHMSLENELDSLAVENREIDYLADALVQNISQPKDSESLVKLLEPTSLSHDTIPHVVDVDDAVTLNCEYSIANRDKETIFSEEVHSEVDVLRAKSPRLLDYILPSKCVDNTVERSAVDARSIKAEDKSEFTGVTFRQNKESVSSKRSSAGGWEQDESYVKFDTLPQSVLPDMIHVQSADGVSAEERRVVAEREAEERDGREGTSTVRPECSLLQVKRVSPPDPSSVGRLRPNEAVMRERRDSMRLARPLDLPTAPPHSRSTSPDLTLPVLLFMETHHSPEYSPARLIPISDSAPRVYGRRGQTEARLSINNNSEAAPNVVVAGVERRDSRRAWRSSGANRTRSSSASSSRVARSVSSDSSSLSSNEASAAVTPRRSTTCTDSRPQAEEGANSNGTTSSSRSSDPSPETDAKTTDWPHGLSSMLACLGCTIGVFNISRFSILSVHFGANFMLQFLVLSLAIGIPLLLVHVCLGRAAGAGPLAIWKVSPLLRGIGAALLLAQAVIGTYSVVGLTWLFVYFRDSFVTNVDQYRWAEPFGLYREDISTLYNGTYKLAETIPDYFNGVVLKRHNLASPDTSFGTVKFQLTFNLAVVWMIVFVALSKGLRSYGKVVYVFSFLPICCTLILCAKLLSLTPHDSVYDVFPETSWNEFFINSKSWAAAAQEAFLTWGLLGACAMQLTSHSTRRIGPGKPDSALRRDCLCLVLLTFSILLLAAFLANTCVHILAQHGYIYSPGSFEEVASYTFLTPRYNPLPSSLGVTPPRHMWHHCNLMGMHVTRPGSDPSAYSGYQLLQLATELIPSTLAIVGPEEMSSFWAVLFYFILILFGIAQQLAIWHCVITGIMAINGSTLKSWETTITFFSCAFGFVLGLPLTTDAGVLVIHFVDYVIVGIWWNCLLHVALLCGMFLVRGRPYSGEAVVGMLYSRSSAVGPLLCFTWNVLLPVALIALCVVDFRVGKYRQLYTWRRTAPGLDYWPLWCKRLGAALQLIPLLTVVFIGFIQTCRYLGSGPPDILERIQLLYRPHVDGPGTSPPMRNLNNNNRGAPRPGEAASNASRTTETNPDPVLPDPPPKYTPPPSYSTATGARIAKALRHSIRRSIRGVRRLAISFGESSTTLPQIPMSISETISQQNTIIPAANSPPDYSVLLASQNEQTTDLPPVNATYITELSHGADIISNQEDFVIPDLIPVEQDIASGFDQRFTLPSARAYQSFNSGSSLQRSKNDGKSTTASDVANLLRSSMRRSVRIRTLPNSFDGSLSQECLLNQAEPVSNTTVNVINENVISETGSHSPLSSPRRVVRQLGSELDEDRTSVI